MIKNWTDIIENLGAGLAFIGVLLGAYAFHTGDGVLLYPAVITAGVGAVCVVFKNKIGTFFEKIGS